jgi:hypothetical protein
MTDLLDEVKDRYHSGVPEGNNLAAAFRADVGYLFSLISPCSHEEWSNITNCEEYEHYICNGCMKIEKRMKTVLGGEKYRNRTVERI